MDINLNKLPGRIKRHISLATSRHDCGYTPPSMIRQGRLNTMIAWVKKPNICLMASKLLKNVTMAIG